ncbi:MAG: polynucleotide adenylyltransferase, partial [Clostridia bacterium]|nr:polynucleotide adenylyltransferase [Clostridia bacterium]
MQISLPKSINYVLDTLHKAGFKAYIVGGCVRDILCEKTPNDFDITTSALPENIKKLFSKTVETGIKHGTVTVIVDGAQIEVTTFRTEGKYIDHRRPESVEFV